MTKLSPTHKSNLASFKKPKKESLVTKRKYVSSNKKPWSKKALDHLMNDLFKS